MHSLLFSSAVVASFLAGMVALFAPCCISVMLPSFLAASFHRRIQIMAMTGVFSLGVALVIVPIAVGASWLSGFISGDHFYVFLAGGLLMIAMGIAMLVGWQVHLPMPGMTAHDRENTARLGLLGVLSLGIFSGAASACCAPVLAGVVALAGVQSSIVVASILGIVYVFGMVAPLFIMAWFWDGFDWRIKRIARGKVFTLNILGFKRSVHIASLGGGIVLVGIGSLVLFTAFNGTSTPSKGWQVTMSVWLEHISHEMLVFLGLFPGWLSALAILTVLAGTVWKIYRGSCRNSSASCAVVQDTGDNDYGDLMGDVDSADLVGEVGEVGRGIHKLKQSSE